MGKDIEVIAEAKRLRRRDLAVQAQERQLERAINTFSGLQFRLPGVDQDEEYESLIAQHGLPQIRGETVEELYKRAARICRRQGLSSTEVAKKILMPPKESRLYASKHISGINPDSGINQLAVLIADKYKSSLE